MEIVEHILSDDEAQAPIAALAEAILPGAGARAVGRGGAWLDERRVIDPEARGAAGASLRLRLPPGGTYAELELGAGDIAYEDEWLLALHKGMGWYVGATPWDVVGNALAALGRYLERRDGAAPPLHLAHQLDRDTTGVLLISKAAQANGPLTAAFAGGRVEKTYRCLVAGAPPEAGEVRSGHGRSAGGRWRVYPPDEVGRALPAGGGRVKAAHTSYAVERHLEGAALVRCAPHTGRTHQIRLRMAHIGHPLLGDARYGGPATYAGHDLPGHLLHAAELRLRHPVTGAALELSSPPMELFAALAGL
ncbi:RluA family pseudouridine synthase [Oscillochloris sp. ZM17-4]|uniref:RluA family pseudouridine synthase n=1 Tax=Oscillochloris sp. ZM17-4 TaxID=2866714 RepID=UPI001C733F83|nr:RluA family pseudouridine synthase [Oscillochloris sp. ZM17-4]MBX0327997.1 RluA family pseudouridine synthase [Oscillochloris sp. ZM17-4]